MLRLNGNNQDLFNVGEVKSPFFPPGGSRDDSEHGIRPALPYFGHQLSKGQCGFDIISVWTFKRNQESLNLILIFFIWQAHFAWKQQSQFNCIEKLRKQDFYHAKYFLCIFLDILLGMTMLALLLPCIPFLIPAWDVHVHLYHSVPKQYNDTLSGSIPPRSRNTPTVTYYSLFSPLREARRIYILTSV